MLYKYRGNSEYTDKIFTDQNVWLSNAKGLNDPFECTIQEIAKEYINEQVKIMKEAHLMGFAHSARLKPDPTTNAVARKIRKASSLDEKHKIMQDAYLKYSGVRITNPIDTFRNFDKQIQNVGIFSLTEDPLNELMWAHYGENSYGIAIGFSKSEGTILDNEEKCIKVEYSDELPKFDSNGFILETSLYPNGTNKQQIAFHDPTFRKAISTKSKSWTYEKEWRYIEPNPGTYPLPSQITEVIFGLRAQEETKQKYYSLVQNLPNAEEIKFFKVEKIKNSNKLELVEIMDSR
ncbi:MULTISPECIES: DUF2971 domain-containing protein [Flavobacterium]|uniref:DUF2971 domain-containing protein n=1 Tax=Flavobacterium TaxID=237 RepID=UPI001FCBBCE0|nr:MULTISPECIES: DUF2971 domain-containing protein [Flavobacterium]UOK42136.1 DUF2971 domain-containing protein [Flavobacterium enshiense]